MTRAAIFETHDADPVAAGRAIGKAVSDRLGADEPDVLILFASPSYDYDALLRSVKEHARPALLVGCSSAGEFTHASHGTGFACGLALRSPQMKFTATLVRDLSRQPRRAAAQKLVEGFQGSRHVELAHRTCLLLADALAGQSEHFIEQLTQVTGGAYDFIGGGAGGDDQFQRRFVFLDGEAVADAAVALEILSSKALGIGARHGWRPATEPLRVTEAKETTVKSLDSIVAAEVISDYASRSSWKFDAAAPLPFFLHNVLGTKGADGYKLRVPLGVNGDGSLAVATEVEEGSAVCIMSSRLQSVADAAFEGTRAAVEQLGPHKPAAALFFDCVATRLRMGAGFSSELDGVRRALGDAAFAGCNTIGQFVRKADQFSGFHNCTAVVCVFPE